MKKPIKSFSLLLLFLSFTYGTTIHVPGDVPTIQEGLNTAIEGDTVLVASGTYSKNIEWPNINGINLIGEFKKTRLLMGAVLEP